jgi:hypothetical protein
MTDDTRTTLIRAKERIRDEIIVLEQALGVMPALPATLPLAGAIDAITQLLRENDQCQGSGTVESRRRCDEELAHDDDEV